MTGSIKAEDIRIIFSDLDGTLLDSRKKVSKENIEAVKEVREKGIIFMAATARPERAVEEYCSEVGFDGVISLNGARVRYKDKNIFNGMTYETASKIITALCENDDKVVALETSTGIYSNTIIEDWFVDCVTDLSEVIKSFAVFKILVFGKNNRLEKKTKDEEKLLVLPEIEKEIKEILDDKTYYTVSENWLCQIMAVNDTKWNGVREVLETLEIPVENAMYFGDDNDDVTCIRNIGYGIAMGNAIPKVKEVADIVIESNDDNGIAKFLNSIF